jgi:hypothetical protein
MSQKISEVELTAVRTKFQALTDDLVKAGLPNGKGTSAKRKVLAYALKRIGAADTSVVSNAQWERFFQQVDGLRFDMVGLARYIGSLPVQGTLFEQPTQPAQPIVNALEPAFSLADIAMLHKGKISAQPDSRPQVRYWKDKA